MFQYNTAIFLCFSLSEFLQFIQPQQVFLHKQHLASFWYTYITYAVHIILYTLIIFLRRKTSLFIFAIFRWTLDQMQWLHVWQVVNVDCWQLF